MLSRTHFFLAFLIALLNAGCGADPQPAKQAVTKGRPKSKKPAKLKIAPPTPPASLPKLSDQELAQLTDGHRKMVRELQRIALTTADYNPYIGDRQARRLRAFVKLLPENPQKPEVLSTLYTGLAETELQLGNENESIKFFKLAIEVAEQRSDVEPEVRIRLRYRLGVAYLRLAETQNCCQRHNEDSCILPLQGGAIHTNKNGSRKAAETFRKVLESASKNSPFYYRSLWLYNLAQMTLGEYPNGVEPKYRLPTAAFQSNAKFPKFRNVAGNAGISKFTTSGGTIGDDFDGDDLPDLFVSNWDPAEQIRFFTNDTGGKFVERTKSIGLKGIVGGLNLIQADYNNDGFLDLLVLRGAWLERAGQHPNSLLRNNGDSTFTDVTFDAGLASPAFPTQTAVWADFNNDSWIDLYVGNEGPPSQLFINQGNGTFVDRASTAGVRNMALCKAVTAGDFDGDGWMDIYVSNSGDKNRLYRNVNGKTFVDVAEQGKVLEPIVSFPCWFWDFDNDGNLDIYVSDYTAKTDHIAKSLMGLASGSSLNCLYKGNGKGGFVDVAKTMKLTIPTAPMGSNFGDLDNDGYLDFYLGTGTSDYADIMPNLMFRNRGGKFFENVTAPGRFGHLQKGHAVVFGDFDRDGDQDVFEQMGGALRGDKFYDVLFENPGFANRWIELRLIGRQENRSAIGSRIRLVVGKGGKQRSIYKHVNSGGSFGANPLAQLIGVGKNEVIDRLEILWGGRRAPQVFKNVSTNRRFIIREGNSELTTGL